MSSVLTSWRLPHTLLPAEAFRWLRGQNPLQMPPYFLTHWKTGKEFFYSHGCLLAFEKTKSRLVVAGEPFVSDEGNEPALWQGFLQLARSLNCKVCGYYVGPNFNHPSFDKVLIGASTKIDLTEFSMKGGKSVEIRRAIRKGKESKLRMVHLGQDEAPEVQKLFSSWMKTKGLFQIQFLLSSKFWSHSVENFQGVYGVLRGEELLGVVSTFPYRTASGDLGMYLDQMIHMPKTNKFALSFLISNLISDFKELGVAEFDMGLNPFVSVNQESMHPLFQIAFETKGLFPSKGLVNFKNKFKGSPRPAYMIFEREGSKAKSFFEMIKVSFRFNSYLIGGRV